MPESIIGRAAEYFACDLIVNDFAEIIINILLRFANWPSLQKLLEETINRILDANPGPLSELLGGKDKVMGFFVGQILAKLKGFERALNLLGAITLMTIALAILVEHQAF